MDKSQAKQVDRIAEPIRSLLHAKGISVNALASSSGIPYATLWRRLRSPDDLTVGDLLRIADELAVSPDALLPETFHAAEVA